MWFADKLAPPLITGLTIALVGSWLLARLNDGHRGRRDHLVKTVDLLLTTLGELQELSADYWSKSNQHPHDEALIEYKIQLLNVLISTCSREMITVSHTVEDLFVRLVAETVTDQFGLTDREPEPDRGRLLAGISGKLANSIVLGRRGIVHETFGASLVRWLGET